jgi:hypothetical protein
VDRGLIVAASGWLLALVLLALAQEKRADTLRSIGVERRTATPVAPPVGFVEIVVPPHSDALVSVPFKPFDAAISCVLADQLTSSTNLANADRVLFWNSIESKYRMAAKLTSTGASGLSSPRSKRGEDSDWFAVEVDDSGAERIVGPVGGEFRIAPGVGFVLVNRQSFPQRVFLSGEVIVESIQSTPIPDGFGLVAYPFTSAKEAGGTKLDCSGNICSTNAFRMGEGYWIKAQGGRWQESRPYPNPFSPSAPVRIEDLLLCDDKATLDIRVTDPSVMAVDILALDLAPADSVANWAGWRVVGSKVDIGGRSEVAWSDDLSASSLKGVRLYVAMSAEATTAWLESVAGASRECPPDTSSVGGGATRPAVLSGVVASTDVVGSGGVTFGLTNTTGTVPGVWRQAGRRSIVFVDIRSGNDAYSGLATRVLAQTGGAGLATGSVVVVEGPKRTIRKGLETVGPEGTLVVQAGSYGENLNVAGRPIRVEIAGKVDLTGPCERSQTPVPCLSNGVLSVVGGTVTNFVKAAR